MCNSFDSINKGFTKCHNVKIQRYEFKRTHVGKSISAQGYGLFAGETIKPYEIIEEYAGELLSYQEYERRDLATSIEQHTYIYSSNSELVIDAQYKGSKARYINHASHGYENSIWHQVKVLGEVRVVVIANRKIDKGEEILINYNLDRDGFQWYKKYETAAEIQTGKDQNIR